MTLLDITNRIEAIAAVQPNIHTLVRNDVYKLDSIPAVKYGVVAWTQGIHQMDYKTGMATYQIYLYYIDRKANRRNIETEIVSFGVQILNNIIFTLAAGDIFIDEAQIQPFIQRFADDCAGAYVMLNIQVPIDRCYDSYETAIDYNTDYDTDYLANGIIAY